MINCTKCEIEEIHPKRLELGFNTCPTCGEAAARVIAEQRKSRVAIAFPKGAYQYISDDYNLGDLG